MTEDTAHEVADTETERASVAPEDAQPSAQADPGVVAQTQTEPPRPLRTGPRPERRALVPLWVYGIGVAALVLIAVGVGVSFAVNRSVAREIPDVTGLDSGVARTRLLTAGFEFQEGDRRFSPRRLGTVLEQEPAAGTLARRGSTVNVVVSGGTEEFAMPDIVGNGIVLARGILEDRGLEVKINTVASSRARDTVLSTTPSAGSLVHTGDIVSVAIAAPDTVAEEIVPYRFARSTFVIDPSKPSGGIDVPLDVARRLRSLLQASGARVLVTRSLSDAAISTADRAKRAASLSANAVVGLDLSSSGSGGFVVMTPKGLEPRRAVATRNLSKALSKALTIRAKAPRTATVAPDPIVRATKAPAARVSLGSLSNREDAAAFRDPAWADQVARALYRALGETYGSR